MFMIIESKELNLSVLTAIVHDRQASNSNKNFRCVINKKANCLVLKDRLFYYSGAIQVNPGYGRGSSI